MPIPPKSIQQRACDTRKSIHLSASAGSGKTRALKDRYLALLDALDSRGLDIDQAVAITFTDKAAAEIKERVLQDLPEATLRKIIRGRQDLRISTIHSFCMNLLKRYPLEAGLPPDFGVLDTRDQAHKIRQAVEDALEASSRDREIMAPLGGSTADELVAVLEFLLSIRSRLRRMEIDAGGPDGLIAAVRNGTGLEAAAQELSALLKNAAWAALFMRMGQCLRTQADFHETCLGPQHVSLAQAGDVQTVYRSARALTPLYFTLKNEPRKKPAISRAKFRADPAFSYSEYETLFTRIQETLSHFLAAYRLLQAGSEALSLLRLEQRAEERYQDAKLREGLLDFDDLEIYAYRLLQSRDSPDILYWLDRRILHFLVDEFQDTSDIQWAIVNKLTEEIFSGIGADKGMAPTLFVVGDAKQSIYRFREANYRLIDLVRDKMENHIPTESREVLTLGRNFRSTPEIIETVNRIFSALWKGSYEPSDCDRKDHPGSVQLFELPAAPEGEQTTGPAEAEMLAQQIRFMIDRKITVYEKETQPKGAGWQARSVQYGDCAVLIQSRTKLKEYETALQQAGIPFRVVGGIGFYEEDEIQALLSTLFFLWNRDDKHALAAALKSPLFGLTDRDIFELTQTGIPMAEALDHTWPVHGKLLKAWMNLAGLVPLAALIHRIVGDTGAYIRFGRRNAQALFNIDKLLDTAREFDRRGYTTLQDFVEWIRNIRATEQREATADMNLPGFEGAVSIMTVHKAKGLEYPVVFLPGMNQQPKSITTGPPVIVESDDRVRMARKDADNPLYRELWEREKDELRREHERLLYVAMTRARDHLVMIGAFKDNKVAAKPNTWLDCLHRAAPKPLFDNEISLQSGIRLYAYPRTAETSSPENPSQSPLLNRDETATVDEQRSTLSQVDIQQIIANLAPIPPSHTPEWRRATDYIEKELPFAPASTASASGISPLIRGSVFHRCLEEYTKQGAYDLHRIIAEHPDIARLDSIKKDGFIADIRTILNTVLTNAACAWIFERTPDSYSELPFLYRKGNNLVSGIIDRLVIAGGKGSVVDYKAISIENKDALIAWTDHYRPQIQVYCEAVKEMFKLSSVEGHLLYLDSSVLDLATKV